MAESKTLPRAFWWRVGPVCGAGQHENCGLVADPYDPEDSPDRKVWACACDCHPQEGPDAE